MQFEKDVFISYAHIDDEALSDGLKGWITEFHKALEVRLSQLLGEEPRIWRDSKLQGNDFFTPEIESQFQKLKIMISVVTPRYVRSEWCNKEVTLFYKAAKSTGGVVVENKSRIFKVIKTPVELEEQPEIMRGLLGYKFFRREREDSAPMELGLSGQEGDKEYWDRLNDVAYDVSQLIRRLSKFASTATTGMALDEVQKPAHSKRTIYLAETSYDLEGYRDALKRELEDKGYDVLPDKDIKPVADVYVKEVAAILNECSLSIHLVGSSYGLVPDGKNDRSVLVLQNEIAAEQSKSRGLRRLIWVPELTTADDPRLTEFIDQLKHEEELHTGSDLLQGSIEDFKFAIFDTLKELDEADRAAEELKQKQAAVVSNAATAGTAVADNEPKTIYIVCDQRDLETVQPIDDYLYDKGFNTIKTVFEGSQEELVVAHENTLRDSDAVLIFYGNGNEAWLRTKISELKRKPAFAGSRPLLTSMVYLSEPATPTKSSFRTRDVQAVINGMAGFKPELFNDFITKLT